MRELFSDFGRDPAYLHMVISQLQGIVVSEN